MRVDLICLSDGQPAPAWPLGETHVVPATVAAVGDAATSALALVSPADALLFWDTSLGTPNADHIAALLAGPGDVWHAGLRLGMAGLPRLIDFVDPVWRFNRDPDAAAPGVSWRLSLRACLVRAAVVGALGGPDPAFDTLAGAALELGHRWIHRGAMMRHVPDLLPATVETSSAPVLTLADELRFARRRYGRVWAAWAAWRGVRHGASPFETLRAWRAASTAAASLATRHSPLALHPPFASEDANSAAQVAPVATRHSPLATDHWPLLADHSPTVTVLIPTLDRYPHLFVLLDHLRAQTVPPLEIIVVDQTEAAARDRDWPARFADLPLRVIWRDTAGQCSSRNAGLAAARGEAVLFLDDDDEAPPDLIARHLAYLARFGVDASCGVAEELGAGALPAAFRLVRDSDVFPTNNALLRTAALAAAGLFDLAYERGERADGDLGMRLYLAGKTLGLNPGASVVHLHAPRGGLRQHRARVVTRGGSRGSIGRRHLLAPTEGYYWSRYFTPRQVHEALLIRTVGTLRGEGSGPRRLLRAALMALRLPDTWRQNRARLAEGQSLLARHPSIPSYRPLCAEEPVTL